MTLTWHLKRHLASGTWAVSGLALVLGGVAFAATPSLAASGSPPPSVQSCAAAVLHMTPGVREPDGALNRHWKIAASISDLPFYAAFPLYPGATPTQEVGHPSYSWGASEFAETAVARYLVSAKPATALAWYQSAMAACGYVYKGYIGYQPGKTLVSKGLIFIAPALSTNFIVYVSLQAASATSSNPGHLCVD